jgi:Chaperone of endosialidase
MKVFYISTLLLFTLSISYSQDITATLSGNTSVEGFSVVNAQGDTVFRVTGEGNVGIGNSNPLGILDTRKIISTGSGKSIILTGESRTDEVADSSGDVVLAGGNFIGSIYSAFGGKITLKGSTFGGGNVSIQGGNGSPFSGAVNIEGGTGSQVGGWINIIAGEGWGRSGSINLITHSSSDGIPSNSGNINLTTEDGYYSGSITLKTGSSSSGVPGSINIAAGESNQYWANINISGGNNTGGGEQGGDINLTPGTGTPDGLVIVNGSGTYSGTWTQSSDERFKKNIRPIDNAVDKIEKLEGVEYEYRTSEFPEKHFSDESKSGLSHKMLKRRFRKLSEQIQKVTNRLLIRIL